MSEIFQNLKPIDQKIFFQTKDKNDVRLGEIVPKVNYEEANIVIVGFPNDEGIKRSGGREGTNLAPDTIREQFYKLTPFGIGVKLFDAGNLTFEDSLEKSHENLNAIVKKIIRDSKKAIVLGGGNDISYPCGKAMAEVFGAGNWLGVNIDAHFDVEIANEINNHSAFRKLLEENLIRPDYFYEIAFQTHFASPVYYRYLHDLGVNLSSLEQIRSRETADLELREMLRQTFIHHSNSFSTFFNFDMEALRSADAPGTSFSSPLGLRAGEFIQLIKFAASLSNTKIIQFTEVNPNFDYDNRTTLLVAIAIHRFCSKQS